MNGTFVLHPAPDSDPCGFSVDVIPSTSDDEYRNPNSGVSPAGAGANGNGTSYVNVPVCNPTSHDIDACNPVAVYDPALDDGDDANAYTAPTTADPARGTATAAG